MLNLVSSGKNVPEECNVVIEIPAHSAPVKYEVDKASGTLFVDRFINSCMRYPCDYGYIPQTLGEDGDPLDALVVSPFPLINGSVISVRPIGILKMTDESGRDIKLLTVPSNAISPLYQSVLKPEDLLPLQLKEIEFFFRHYKMLEVDKWVSIEGWGNLQEAYKEIKLGVQRFIKKGVKPPQSSGE